MAPNFHHPVVSQWQEILNAREVPRRLAQVEAREPIPVQARIVWEVDGEEWCAGTAVGWTSTRPSRVLFYFKRPELRCSTLGCWLIASDIERISTETR